MSSKTRLTTVPWLYNVAMWLSSGFLSIVVLAACLVPAMWALGITVPDITTKSTDFSQACEMVLCLAAAIGISTFLSHYILLGHPTAYAGSLLAICTTGVFTNRTVFVLAVAPIILGSIAGYYLNRYTKYKTGLKNDSTTFSFVCMRIACACFAMLLTMALVQGHYHWSVCLISMVKTGLYLALAFRGIWRRAETQLAA